MNKFMIVAIAYGLLSGAGGIMGYAKAKSLVSLISGSITGILLIVFGVFMAWGQGWARWGAIAIVTLLIITFIVRLIKTRKPMPAGLMIVTGIPTLILLLMPES